VIVIGKQHALEFKVKHPTIAKAVDRTLSLLETNHFRSPIEMKRIFAGNIDFVGSKTVIDCGGNKARFILVIRFQANVALIEAVLTHSEYDKSKWKD
jgi:mRNA interferase HigB